MRWGSALAALAAAATATSIHAQTSSVRIEGLDSGYGPKSTVSAIVQNLSSKRIEINVAVEDFDTDHWREALTSVTDPKHPYGKAVKLTAVDKGASIGVSFVPLERRGGISPFGDSSLPLSLRLRVDVYPSAGGKLIESVHSSVFKISS